MADTAGLTHFEESCYLRLLCAARTQSDDWCSLPNDTAYLRRVARADNRNWQRTGHSLLARYFILRDNRYVHPRLEEEAEIQRQRREQQSFAGKESAKKRMSESEPNSNKRSTDAATTVEHPYQREGNSSSASASKPLPAPVLDLGLVASVSAVNTKTCPSATDEQRAQKSADTKDWLSGFDSFWTAYPHRANSSRKEALKVWARLQPKDYRREVEPDLTVADRLFQSILAALEESIYAWKRDRTDEQHIPHHSVWLNKELWRNHAEAEG
jgi:uncharacterized protein YdaU (DUF1376 family)